MGTHLVSKQWEVEGVLTDVTSAKLSDPTGTYGVKETVSGDVIVADDTAMTKSSTGTYQYSFTSEAGIAYTAYIEIVYAGATYHLEEDIPAVPAETTSTTTTGTIWTYYDAVVAARDFVGGNSTGVAMPALLRAIASAYREVTAARDWSFLYKHGRVHVKAPYTTGTITYDHTGGTYERELTLADGTWPSWADTGVVLIDSVLSRVVSRESDTVVTLDSALNPGADVDAGTSYSLYPEYYELPERFERFEGPWGEGTWGLGRQVSADTLMALERFDPGSDDMSQYTIGGIPGVYGKLALYIHPSADAAETIDFIYKCRPRDLRFSGHNSTVDTAGTITANGSTAIVGSSTAFNSKMVGAVLRIGDATNVPTSLDGRYPYAEEHVISSVTDTTHLTLSAASSLSSGSLKYCITDPIDLNIAVENAFMRCVEKHLAITMNMKNKREMFAAYDEALFKAKGADHRSTQRRIAGGGMPLYDPYASWDHTGADYE